MENKKIKSLIAVFGAIFIFFVVSKVASAASYGPVYAFSNNPRDTYPIYESSWTSYNPGTTTYYGNPVSTQYAYYYQLGYNAANTSNNSSTASTSTKTTTSTTAKPSSSVVNNYYYGSTSDQLSGNQNPTMIPVNTNADSTVNGANYANNLGASAYNPYMQQSGSNVGNNIPALSLKGSGGFLPSSIWQWILVVFLVLIIIIISRSFVKRAIPGDPYGTSKPLH